MQTPPTQMGRHLSPVGKGHHLEAWRVNELQRSHNHRSYGGRGFQGRQYDGPFAGWISDTDELTISDGPWRFGDSKGLLTSGDETVDMSAYTDETVYVYMHLRYGMTVPYEILTSTSRPAANGWGDVCADIVLGVAVLNADSYVTSWTQEQYGPIRVERYCGPFSPSLGAADATTVTLAGFIYHGGGVEYKSVSDTLSPGNSKTGWAYWEISYNSGTGALVEDLKENSVSGTPPSGVEDKRLVIIAQFETNASGEFIWWDQVHHGEIYVPRYTTYDPTDGSTAYTIGPDTPLLLEASASDISFDIASDLTFDARKGAVYTKTSAP